MTRIALFALIPFAVSCTGKIDDVDTSGDQTDTGETDTDTDTDADTDSDTDTDADTDSDTDTDTDSDTDTDTTAADSFTLCINEFMASNETTFQDAAGAYPDWIELHNYGTETVSLHGVGITDNLGDPSKHSIEDLVIDAGGFVLLFADRDTDEGVDHLDFNLSIDGEELGLYTPGGAELDAFEFGKQVTDVSAYRTTDCGDEWSYTKSATPGASNE